MNASSASHILTSGQPVPMHRVETELTRLWREAGGEAGQSVVRACLWNLVVFHEQASHADYPHAPNRQAMEELLHQITPLVPSRVIRLEVGSEDYCATAPQLEAKVSTHCITIPGGGLEICAEEILLVACGEEGINHFPALVRALLVPDIPVALVWLGSLPHKGRILKQLISLSQRMLIDTQSSVRESHLVQVNDLERFTQANLVDLGWMRLTPVRYLLAGLFDPPGRAQDLGQVEHIRVATMPQSGNTGFLMLGWLLSRLGVTSVKAMEDTSPTPRFRWKAHLGDRTFEVELTSHLGDGGLDGILQVEILAGGHRYAMTQLDHLHVLLESPDCEQKKLALHGWDNAELVVAGLGGQGMDNLYPQVLAMTATLAEEESWNQ